jgi:hypothetical protein
VCRPEQRRPADVFHHMDMVEMQVPGDVSHVVRCFFWGLFKEGSLKSLDRTLASSRRLVAGPIVVD